MQHVALTAKYRPQSFAEVAGQDTLKSILSRAALEDRVAPAYLFSGTRGVGKTTLARIFAKALNCRTAPAAEPCNQCDQCRAVTAGSAVDVVEIDGASNRGIDDVRRLREVVGYAPMEGRYKIFIIDEAHMLSREAFNALLKTLEEPPARVTFILATTEPHKFPATIISRCQHYVFKRLTEKGLTDHLSDVLTREGLPFEESALRLIARRGAGSVRDSMSLLGQVIALGEDTLTEDAARSVLGLAGQEVYGRILHLVKQGDSVALSLLLRELLDQGLDMGFFLRELSSLWRNVFMLRQSGAEALPLVDLPEHEAAGYLEASKDFSLQHVHACWQMTLEGQRRVLTSLEPALALELLLLNLAMLPRLVSLESLSSASRKNTPPSGSASSSEPGSAAAPPKSGPVPPPAGASSSREASGRAPDESGHAVSGVHSASGASGEAFADISGSAAKPPAEADAALAQAPGATDEGPLSAQRSAPSLARPLKNDDDGVYAGSDLSEQEADEAAIQSALEELSRPMEATPETADSIASHTPRESHSEEINGGPDAPDFPDWARVLERCVEDKLPLWFTSLIRSLKAERNEDALELTPPDAFSAGRLEEASTRALLEKVLLQCCSRLPELRVGEPAHKHRTQEEIRNEVMQHPLVQEMKDRFGARYVDSGEYR